MVRRRALLCSNASARMPLLECLCSNASAQREQFAELQVGADAPDITLIGIDSKEFQLSDVTKSGKNVALMFSRARW